MKRKIYTTLLIIGLIFMAFGYWGYFTTSGAHAFDEMNGLIPFFAWGLSWLLVPVSLLLLFVAGRKK